MTDLWVIHYSTGYAVGRLTKAGSRQEGSQSADCQRRRGARRGVDGDRLAGAEREGRRSIRSSPRGCAQAADELGYQPNGPARNLRRQEAAVVALIISDVENPFFTAIARGVEDVAHEVGYSVVLCNSDESVEKENRYIDIAIQERVAGVILSPSGPTSTVAKLA